MNSKKVLSFLNLLNEETVNHGNELAQLYKRALDENDDVVYLKRLLNDYEYYFEIGSSLYERGEALIKKVYSTPAQSLEILPEIKQMHESIDHSVEVCDRLMSSPMPFLQEIPILKKKDTMAYMAALKTIVSTCIYLITLYRGMDAVKYLTWDERAGVQERLYAVNTKFLPALCNVQRPEYSWVIRRKHMGGKALFGSDYFYLSYENTKSVEMLCSALHKEPIETHAFLNIDAYEADLCDVPFCWGIGNILSVTPATAIDLLQNDVVRAVRAPNFTQLQWKTPTPAECIKQLSDGHMFCISPDELLLALNRWQIGHDIEMRKRTRNCLFCGKHISGNTYICPSHYTSELT